MKTVQQIMQETNAEANVWNFRYMQQHYSYDQKVRHAENVAASFEEQCRERGLNCHVSVGGLDSITLLILKNFWRCWRGWTMELYHVTTPKKAKRYRESGCIKSPVRGFTTIMGAMAWAIKTGRTVIYQVKGEHAYKLPDHHNAFGEAWWIDGDVPIENISCVFSADKDA